MQLDEDKLMVLDMLGRDLRHRQPAFTNIHTIEFQPPQQRGGIAKIKILIHLQVTANMLIIKRQHSVKFLHL